MHWGRNRVKKNTVREQNRAFFPRKIRLITLISGITFLFLATSLGVAFTGVSQVKTAPVQKNRDITWQISLNITEPGGAHDYGVFGEAPDAHDGPPADTYDIAKPPPSMTPYVRIWFNDNLAPPYTQLWMDYRHYPATSKTWNVSIVWVPQEYTQTTVTIRWNSTAINTTEYTSILLCTETGTPLRNMRLYKSYTFTCPAYIPQNFKILCQSTPPHADFTYVPLNPTTQTVIFFTDTSTDSDGFITSWFWSFDDGTTSIAQNPTHQYTLAKTYLVTLTITDNTNFTNTSTKTLVVNGVPDLVIVSLTATTTRPGITITAIIKNKGDADITTPFQTTLYGAYMWTNTPYQYALYTQTTSSLAAGANTTITHAFFSLPSYYYYAVWADTTHVITESNEYNNGMYIVYVRTSSPSSISSSQE